MGKIQLVAPQSRPRFKPIIVTDSLVEQFYRNSARPPYGEACVLWQAYTNKKGYGQVGTREAAKYLAHRVSYAIHVGDPGELLVCHDCPAGDTPACVNPTHLFLGTYADNSLDSILKGRSVQRKLVASDILEIRSRRKAGESLTEVGRDFDLPKATVWKIVHKKTWRHVH